MTVTNYIYDGFQLLCETDENNNVTRTYINEPDDYTHPIGHIDHDTDKPAYYHYDGQGNTRAVTDENENVTDTFDYDSWGNLLARTGMTNVPFQFGGEHGYYKDEELDRYYVMARNYDPSLIRWLSVDPMRHDQSSSLYVYVYNSPAVYFDQSGQLPMLIQNEGDKPGATCTIQVCQRPVRAVKGGVVGHVYIRVGTFPDDQLVFGGGPGNPLKHCDIDGDALRAYAGPWTKTWGEEGNEMPNPDWPKEGEEKQHHCNPFVIGVSCDQLTDCMDDIGAGVGMCCIPYLAYDLLTAFKNPRKGCNSNCVASWMLEYCTKGKVTQWPKGQEPNDPKNKFPFPPNQNLRPTPGFGTEVPDCVTRFKTIPEPPPKPDCSCEP